MSPCDLAYDVSIKWSKQSKLKLERHTFDSKQAYCSNKNLLQLFPSNRVQESMCRTFFFKLWFNQILQLLYNTLFFKLRKVLLAGCAHKCVHLRTLEVSSWGQFSAWSIYSAAAWQLCKLPFVLAAQRLCLHLCFWYFAKWKAGEEYKKM